MRVVCWADSFEWEHSHIRDLVFRQVKVFARWGVQFFVGHTAPMFIESVFCSPLCLSNVHPVSTSYAPQLVNHISGITVQRRRNVPCFACPGTFMCCDSDFASRAHHTLFAHILTILETELVPLGSPLQ